MVIVQWINETTIIEKYSQVGVSTINCFKDSLSNEESWSYLPWNTTPKQHQRGSCHSLCCFSSWTWWSDPARNGSTDWVYHCNELCGHHLFETNSDAWLNFEKPLWWPCQSCRIGIGEPCANGLFQSSIHRATIVEPLGCHLFFLRRGDEALLW